MTIILNSENGTRKFKFLYSYGGKILPRRCDGELRYVGGYTRILAVDRSIAFAELMVRFGELCGSSMCLKCKLPSQDLDVLISITCDEDLANVIEEYDRVISSNPHQETMIRAVLFPLEASENTFVPSVSLAPLKFLEKVSPPSSPVCVLNFSPSEWSPRATEGFGQGGRNSSPAVRFPFAMRKDGGKSSR